MRAIVAPRLCLLNTQSPLWAANVSDKLQSVVLVEIDKLKFIGQIKLFDVEQTNNPDSLRKISQIGRSS